MAEKMFNTPNKYNTKQLAKLGWEFLPKIVKSYEQLERKFQIECKRDVIDDYKLRVYFVHLLMLTDNLKEEYRRLMEMVLEE